MITFTAKELKNKTGDVIRSIRAGEEVLLLYRGRPLAKVIPFKDASVLSELSGILKDVDKDKRQVKHERLKEKYEDIY